MSLVRKSLFSVGTCVVVLGILFSQVAQSEPTEMTAAEVAALSKSQLVRVKAHQKIAKGLEIDLIALSDKDHELKGIQLLQRDSEGEKRPQNWSVKTIGSAVDRNGKPDWMGLDKYGFLRIKLAPDYNLKNRVGIYLRHIAGLGLGGRKFETILFDLTWLEKMPDVNSAKWAIVSSDKTSRVDSIHLKGMTSVTRTDFGVDLITGRSITGQLISTQRE